MARGLAPAALILALAIGACGGATGVSSGATVSVYLSAPMSGPEGPRGRSLCGEAKSALAHVGGQAGDLRVKLTCLDASGQAGAWTLARVGGNARQAVEDSTTVAYIAEPALDARRQSRPILEEAEIATVTGGDAMQRILGAIEDAPGGSLRESVSEALG